MANTVIQLKFSTVTATPTSLNVAEPAYSYSSNTLFIGSPAGTGSIAIGGKFYLDQQQNIYNLTNAAFTAANAAGSSANVFAAWNHANSGFHQANAAFGVANTASDRSLSAGIYANGAFVAANSAGVYANGAFAAANNRALKAGDTFTGNVTVANGNVTISNTTTSVSNTSGALIVTGGVGVRGNVYADAIFDGGIEILTFAQNAYNTGNAAFNASNTVSTFSTAAYNHANAAFITANTANDRGLSAGIYANGAFAKANTQDAINTTQNNSITSAFVAANSAGVYANGAFVRANNSLNANVGGTVTGNVTVVGDLAVTGNITITGNAFSINVGSIVANDSLIVLAGTNYTSDSLDIGVIAHYNAGANAHTGLIRDFVTKEWYLFKEYTPEIGANNNIDINSPSFITDTLNANIKSNIITVKGVDLQTFVNASFTAANSAGVYANGAFIAANTADTKGTSAGIYANGAFAAANNRALKVGDTFTGNVTIANGNLTISNATTSVSNTTGALIVTGGVGVRGNVYADAIFDGGIEILLFAQNAYNQANSGFAVANSASIYANGAFSTANIASDRSLSAGIYANGAFVAANSAGSYANSAFAAANAATATDATQNNSITAAFIAANSAGIYANGAFAKANLDVTNIAIAAADYGSATRVASFKLEANGRISTANSTLIALDASQITSGTLPVGRGGTGNTSLQLNAVLLGQGTSAVTTVGSSVEGHVLTINSSGVPTFEHISGGTF